MSNEPRDLVSNRVNEPGGDDLMEALDLLCEGELNTYRVEIVAGDATVRRFEYDSGHWWEVGVEPSAEGW